MKKFGIILFGLGMLLAQPVAAQIAPALPDQGTVKYTYNNPGQYQGASFGGIYVGPYAGTLRAIGGNPTDAAMSLYCVDFFNFAVQGQVVAAVVSNLDGGNTSLARLGASGLESYKKTAFLSSLFQTYGSIGQFSGLSQTQAWSGIHAAIWYFTSGEVGRYTSASYLSAFRDYATDNYLNYNGFHQWSVLTTMSVGGNPLWASQEFLVQTQGLPRLTQVPQVPPTVTPEPQTYGLMLSGLIFL
ncbi:MAG: hypothetical protein ABIF09_03575, partial [Gemmatimonadota bacterium]